MTELPMPSDVKRAAATGAPAAASTGTAAEPVGEPPSAKLLVRLFLIPLLIVAAAVGVMFLIGLLAGGAPTFREALAGLENPGGGRTGGVLVGPASKQRYIYAKAVADHMKERMRGGMPEAERVELAARLMAVVDAAGADEGEVKHFLLLALGRAWEVDPSQPAMDSADAVRSRQGAVRKLLANAQVVPVPPGGTQEQRHRATDLQVRVRKAAVLALAFLAGRDEVRDALPALAQKLGDPTEDVDVRIAAATSLGRLATPADADALAALRRARDVGGDENVELVWSASLSLAMLNQPDAAGTILMLLNRDDLKQLKYLDRETDWKNPVYRTLNEQEQQRILINVMDGASHLDVPEVQARIRAVAEHDPSPRVREAGRTVLAAGERARPATTAPREAAATRSAAPASGS